MMSCFPMSIQVVVLLQASVWITACAILSYASVSPNAVRGISPEGEKYYESETIWCKDLSKSFSRERLNDDFCDCPDGTDEPGTSACPGGMFYCRNAGHVPLSIFSSQVNDGVCDCCDGSDEYNGNVKCVDTCWEAGKDLRSKLVKRIKIFREGLDIRKRDVEHAKQMLQQDKVELSKLKQEEKKFKDIVTKLKMKKEAIERAEKVEQIEREKAEQKRREAEKEASGKEPLETESFPASEDKIPAEDIEDVTEQKNAEEEGSMFDIAEGLSKEEVGRLVASRWTGVDPDLENKVEQNHHSEIEEGINGSENEEFDIPVSETHDDDDDDEFNENEEEDYVSESDDVKIELPEKIGSAVSDSQEESNQHPSLWTKLHLASKSLLRALKLYRSPVDKSEADQIRRQYDEESSKLEEIQSKISELEKKLEQDFGKEGEFYNFYDLCLEMKQNKYVYKVCPYKHGLQTEGHSTTTLGNWDGFKDNYKSMHFVHGDRCWNGPDRSLKVKLRCGVKTEIHDVDEPSRCEYTAQASTPALCLKEKLDALQQQLDNQGGASLGLHDEL